MTRQGFSLAELLVVVAIAAILTGLIFPAIAYAKIAGHRSSDLAELRQVGLATELYAQDNGEPTLYTQPLAENGYLTTAILVSELDITAPGYANHFRAFAHGRPDLLASAPTKYRDSFLPLPDCGVTAAGLAEVLSRRNAGWLVSFSDRAPTDPLGRAPDVSSSGELVFQGVYLRLLMDGSVQTEHHIVSRVAAGEITPIHNPDPRDWFGDRP